MSDLCSLTMLAAYFSTFKIIVILLLLFPWLYAATWMNRDTARVHTIGVFWCGIVLGAGAAGVLAALLVPHFAVGLPLYLVLTGGTIGTYVVYRNKRVVPEARVLTVEHIKAVLSRGGAHTVEVVQHLKLYDSDGRAVNPPDEGSPEQRQGYNGAQELLRDVLMLRASEVGLSPTGPQTGVKFVVDGVLQKRPSLDHEQAEMLIDFVKEMAGMNVEDKRRPQTGHISLDMGAVRLDVRVSAAGTTHGQQLQLRVLQEAVQTRLEELGMPESLQTRLVEINAADHGLIIVSGPRRNGATSTLYSLLRQHDAFLKQLVTLESSQGVELENITQNAYADRADLAGKLASVLRLDPNVVMVDKCDTPQAAEQICQGARVKNLLLGCVADNAFQALAKWVKVCGGDRKKALEPLRAVTCQKLLRKICPACREAYRPGKDMLAKLNLPAEKIKEFYRPPTKPLTDEKGKPYTCPTCQGTGYMGRTATFELLELNDEVRDLILSDAPVSQIKAECRKPRCSTCRSRRCGKWSRVSSA
ncbi:hypothetical protein LCGC14_1545870 [marine sediment metagenome]|uniref:Bacterial type II secretion system protein E domain-containing protein n=1 Tax=marine sediment metagenome TaxID=412755 RepID=A0A0F9IRP3_9ZZZZ